MDPQSADMNLTSVDVLHSPDSELSPECDTAVLPVWQQGSLSTDVYSVIIFTTIVLLISLPSTILLNALVIAAVKSTFQLRTKSNILLACLATTDLVFVLIGQPSFITMEVHLLEGKSITDFCALDKVLGILFTMFCSLSLFHLVLISLERLLAIKHPFFYDNHISARVLIIASAITWTLVIILAIKDFLEFENYFLSVLFDHVPLVCCIPVIVMCHIVIYIEVRRHEKQITSQQISLEAREKFMKEKKALKTTTVIILTVFFCNSISIVISFFLKDMSSFDTAYILFFLAFTLTLLNSIMNPLIYAARNRRFRVAFVQLLFRKQLEQADQIEIRMFRSGSNTVRPQAESQGLP